MIRRWWQSLDVGFDPISGALAVIQPPATQLVAGVRTVEVEHQAVPLFTEPTPCREIWLAAPDADFGINARPVLIGDAQAQVLAIAPHDQGGLTVAIDDAGKLYLRAQVSFDSLVYLLVK